MKLTKDEEVRKNIFWMFEDTWRVGWCLGHGVMFSMFFYVLFLWGVMVFFGTNLMNDGFFEMIFILLMAIGYGVMMATLIYIFASWWAYFFILPKKLKKKKVKK